MTLWASRDASRPDHITVQVTSGTVTVKVEEHEGHVGVFWAELGRVLAANPAHAEARAKAAYERYMRHVEEAGEEPGEWSWEGLDQAGRDHWVTALSG